MEINKFKITYYFSHAVSTALVVIALWQVVDSNLAYKIMFASMGIALEFSKTWIADLVIRKQLVNKVMYTISTILCVLLICLSLLSTIGSISVIAVESEASVQNKKIQIEALEKEKESLLGQQSGRMKESSSLGADFYSRRDKNEASTKNTLDALKANAKAQVDINTKYQSSFFDNITNSVGFNKHFITLFYIIGFSLGLELTVILTLVVSNKMVSRETIEHRLMRAILVTKLDIDISKLARGEYTENTNDIMRLMEGNYIIKRDGKWQINYGKE